MKNLVTLAVVLAMAAASQAASIGMNFYNNGATDPTAEQLGPTDTAGYVDVAQSNWNNMGTNSGGNWISGSLGCTAPYGGLDNGPTVFDSAGAAVDGMAVIVGAYDNPLGSNNDFSTNPGNAWGATSANWGFSGADETLHRGVLRPSPRFTITGIPYAQYDIYLYVGPNGNQGGSPNLGTITADSAGTVDTAPYLPVSAWKWSNSYYLATTTEKGNVVHYVGNTASDITIDFNDPVADWPGVAAIQIVEVPEPATMSLLGMGAVALLRRRK